MWIVTRAGLAFYEGNALHAFKLPPAFSELNGPELLALDRDGVPYLATLNGLVRLDVAKGKVGKFGIRRAGLPAAEVEAVTVGPDGHVWFGSDHRVGWIDAEGHPQFFPAQSGLPREKIVTILRDGSTRALGAHGAASFPAGSRGYAFRGGCAGFASGE